MCSQLPCGLQPPLPRLGEGHSQDPSWKNSWALALLLGATVGSTRVRVGSSRSPGQGRAGWGGLLPPQYSWSSNPDSWPQTPSISWNHPDLLPVRFKFSLQTGKETDIMAHPPHSILPSVKNQALPRASPSSQLQSSTAPRRPSYSHLQTLPFFFMEGFSESLPLIFP